MKQKPILITGAAGFIGARFVEACNLKEVPTISVDTPSYFTSRKEHHGLDFGKIVDREKLFEWLKTDSPPLSAIVHLGACTDTTETDKAYLMKMNLEYSKKLWIYATERRLPLVYASSAATYGDGSLDYEDDESLIPKLKPLNPYGESKRQFDHWVLDQEREQKKPPVWAGFKFFNVFGFGERHKKKMSSVVLQAYDQIQTTGEVRLFKSYRSSIPHGEQKRDFIHVKDVIDVLHFALQKPIERGIFNLGTGKARTFLDLVYSIFQELEKPQKIVFIDMPNGVREHYQYFTKASMDRLRAQGYTKPFTPLEEGITEYVRQLKS